MMEMLNGKLIRATFDGHVVVLTYRDVFLAEPLHRALYERRIPVEALQDVEVSAESDTLRFVLRPGVDPLLAVFGDSPDPALDPYRILYDRTQHEAAVRLRDVLLRAMETARPVPQGLFLLPPPRPAPVHLRGLDGRVEFDGQAIRLTWLNAAKREKTDAGPGHIVPLSVVETVTWSERSLFSGGALRIRLVGHGEPVEDPRMDPYAVWLSAAERVDAILFAAAVRAALAQPPDPVTVSRAARSTGAEDFTAIAERNGVPVGRVHAHTPAGTPQLREIDLLESTQDTGVHDALLGEVLRWASRSAAVAVTRWVSDWPDQRAAHEQRGFVVTRNWRATAAGEERQLRATLRPDPEFRRQELLGVLGAVGQLRYARRYLVRHAVVAASLLAACNVVFLLSLWLHLTGIRGVRRHCGDVRGRYVARVSSPRPNIGIVDDDRRGAADAPRLPCTGVIPAVVPR